MKLTITVDMDGAAFHVQSNDEHYGEPAQGDELAHLLGSLGMSFEGAALKAGDNGTMRDTNGNTVLTWRVRR